MAQLTLKKLGIAASLSLVLVAAGCSSSDSKNESVEEKLDYSITGIEPGAGVLQKAEKATEEYDNLNGWEVEASSSGAMATALGEAIDREKPIIITGWTPHWMFQKYDLHYLEDPKGVFGKSEEISTIARKGLAKDKPEAYKILDQFQWKTEDIEKVMLDIKDGKSPSDAASAWIKDNKDKVDEWTKGVQKGDGDTVKLAYVEWDSEVASTNVLKQVLEDKGFKVKATPLDNAVMWQAVAKSEVDASVSAWLPLTHGDLYKKYKDQLENLGPNLEGAKIGLVVPDYMDIKSIEELKPKK